MSQNMVTNLDAAGHKENFKEHLKTQEEFNSYDFEGSAMSTVMDLLAKNSENLSFLAHMMSNEMFIDSAQMRSSVVSHAKRMSYTPRSIQSAKAIIDITVTPDDVGSAPSTLTMDKEARFVTQIDGEVFYFVTNDVYVTSLDDGKYMFNNVEVYEGYYLTKTYTAQSNNEVFKIPNADADTSLLVVNVQNSITDTTTLTHSNADSLIGVDSASKVYYLTENGDGKYEVEFGDGSLGAQIQPGNIVILKYMISKGDAANGCSVFDSVSSIGEYNNVTIETKQKAFGGVVGEDIESIRFIAPKANFTQKRAVTIDDYIPITKQVLPQAVDIRPWGGEDHDIPTYGTVFIAVKMPEGTSLTDSTKESIAKNDLKRFAVGSVTPVIVDAVTVDVKIGLVVVYDTAKLSIKQSELIEDVKDSGIEYSDTQLSKFKKKFNLSQFITDIKNTNSAITNSYITKLELTKNVGVLQDITQSINVSFGNNELKPGSINMGGFRILDTTTTEILGKVHYFKDDGNGKLIVCRSDGNVEIVVDEQAGTVDYANGKIFITNFTPLETSTGLSMTVSPLYHTIEVVREEILEISDRANLEIVVEGE